MDFSDVGIIATLCVNVNQILISSLSSHLKYHHEEDPQTTAAQRHSDQTL